MWDVPVAASFHSLLLPAKVPEVPLAPRSRTCSGVSTWSRDVASVDSKDQDYQVHYSISLCCCAETDVGFSSFLRNRVFSSFFLLDRTGKDHCSLPSQEQGILCEMERKGKREQERRAWSLLCHYGTEGCCCPGEELRNRTQTQM